MRRLLLLFALAATLLVATTGVASAQPERRALVVQVTWDASANVPEAPADREVVDIALDVHANKAWYSAVSHGQFPGWRVTATGPFHITTPRFDDGPERCGKQFSLDIRNRVLAQLELDPELFDAIVVYFAEMPCSNGQFGWAGGSLVYLNGSSTQVAVLHELGHNLGLPHSIGLLCKNAQNVPVSLSSSCVQREAGDPYTVMGYGGGTLPFSASEQEALGWMTGRFHHVPFEDPAYLGASFTIRALDGDTSGLQALRIMEGDREFWVEYTVGRDQPPNATLRPGVVVRMKQPGLPRPALLDLTPGSPLEHFDARLPVGQQWVNPLGRLRITVESANTFGALVRIDTPDLHVPSVKGLTVNGARGVLTTAGFTVGTVSGTPDQNCNNLGRVVTQLPLAGQLRPAGTPVNLKIGQLPPTPCP
jgi:hypothetical protein